MTWDDQELEIAHRALYDAVRDPCVEPADELAQSLRKHRHRIVAHVIDVERMPREVALDMERGWTPELVRRLVRDYVSLVDRVSSLRPTTD